MPELLENRFMCHKNTKICVENVIKCGEKNIFHNLYQMFPPILLEHYRAWLIVIA